MYAGIFDPTKHRCKQPRLRTTQMRRSLFVKKTALVRYYPTDAVPNGTGAASCQLLAGRWQLSLQLPYLTTPLSALLRTGDGSEDGTVGAQATRTSDRSARRGNDLMGMCVRSMKAEQKLPGCARSRTPGRFAPSPQPARRQPPAGSLQFVVCQNPAVTLAANAETSNQIPT